MVLPSIYTPPYNRRPSERSSDMSSTRLTRARTRAPRGGRIADSEFTTKRWRIHEFIDGFVLEDVWELPIAGDREDFGDTVSYFASDHDADENVIVRALFAARWRLGQLFGWDDERQQIGRRAASLRDALPEDLAARRGPDMADKPFRSVYLTEDEWVAEFSASIGHIVMHCGWVEGDGGTYYTQMASLVKRYGRFGGLYMSAIRPIRYWIVYPLWFRDLRKRRG